MSTPGNNTELVSNDYLQRFVFDQLDARGCIVRLKETCKTIQTTHHYPQNLAKVINQFSVAACLLRDSIKIQGSVTIQLRSNGPIKLIMADCLSNRDVRSIAEYDIEGLHANDDIDFSQLSSGAILAITITPDEGERYQAIVPIENATLEECLEDYFARSEQLPTWFRFMANEEQAIGMAIHALPQQVVSDAEKSKEHFERLKIFLKTLSFDEAIDLNSEQILTRLFHDDECRLFDPYKVSFGCPCSLSKSLDALHSLGEDDLRELIKEQKTQGNEAVVVDCHFCFQRYSISFDDLGGLSEKVKD